MMLRALYGRRRVPHDVRKSRCPDERQQQPSDNMAQTRTAIRRNARELGTREHQFQIAREIILTRERMLRSREPVPRRADRFCTLSAVRSHRRTSPLRKRRSRINFIPISDSLIILQSIGRIQEAKIKTWY